MGEASASLVEGPARRGCASGPIADRVIGGADLRNAYVPPEQILPRAGREADRDCRFRRLTKLDNSGHWFTKAVIAAWSGDPGSKQHSKQVARIVRVGQKVEILAVRVVLQQALDIAERAEILGGKANAVKQRDLLV